MYYFSLGSNVGDRMARLRKALEFLRTRGSVLAVSTVYETIPVSMGRTGNFLNAVVCLQSEIDPEAFLDGIKDFEKAEGRDPDNSHLQPRVIDIDILLADDLVLDTPKLTVPHARMCERAFVLVPLCEIGPGLFHPLRKRPFCELLEEIGDAGIVARLGPIGRPEGRSHFSSKS